MPDGLLDHNQFCKSDSNFRGTVRQVYGFVSLFLFHFELKFMYVKSGGPGQTPLTAVGDLGLHCLPLIYKKA